MWSVCLGERLQALGETDLKYSYLVTVGQDREILKYKKQRPRVAGVRYQGEALLKVYRSRCTKNSAWSTTSSIVR